MDCFSDKLNKIKNDLTGTKITVLGSAKSGIASARLAKRMGAKVFISEKYRITEHAMQVILKERFLFEEGGHTDRVFQADLIILSPGIPSNIPILIEAGKRQIPVISEIEFAFWFEQGRVVAITGSQGKSTTTTLIGKILEQQGYSVFIGGNIGFPYTDFVAQTTKDSITVLEVSSFQLETIHFFKPNIVVLTNITPNHLDRYDSFEDYVNAKLNIFSNLSSDTTIVYNADDETSGRVLQPFLQRGIGYSFSVQKENESLNAFLRDKMIMLRLDGQENPVIAVDEIGMKGKHNVLNVMAASLVGKFFSCDIDVMKNVFRRFRGIPHRLEFVREINGVQYYNDSKATTVSSLKFALESFVQPIILIVGGKDKGGSFASLREIVANRVKKAILIGEAASRIGDEWKDTTELVHAKTLEEAVRIAYNSAVKDDIVLLSPACSSFDMFHNFEDRGNQFKSLVQNLERIA
jgi:UDP-N-acetylmuramoylalanine--D-glutamate ligase